MGVFAVFGGSVTHRYLMNKTKDEIASIAMRYLREMEKKDERTTELEAESRNVKMLLDMALCPQCDGSGAYYDSVGDVCQCQWCYERGQALQEG